MANENETTPKAAAPASESPKTEAPVLVMTQEQLDEIIAAATNAARTDVMGDVVKLLAGRQAEGASDTSSMISELAVAIAGMSDQGQNRRIIPPAEAKRREEAALRMGAILIRIDADPSLRPHYEVVAKTWLDDTLIEEWVPDGDTKWKRNEIIWRGAPNSAMRPKNAIAEEVFTAYLESIGGTTKNMSGVRDQPSWVGNGGLQIVGQSTTAAAHGLVREPAEPATLGAKLTSSNELTTSDNAADNPNADKIRILGKTMAPAERTARGKQPSLSFPSSN